MECNKEEALRAKAIAEKKMQSKDFVGARKLALKAQQLYSDVENVSQMLMVCDVHCAAEKKLLGIEMDWYGILQLEVTADEAMIKKQYRKFALQLHPDKNKFSGAEGAFKLIGEAQRILLDKEKRRAHDSKRGSHPVPYRPQPNANWNSNVVRNNNRSNPVGLNSQNQQSQQSAQPGYTGSQPTFWTACPFCSVRYQYYREVINRSIRCQNCSRPFVTYDMMEAPKTADFSRPVFPQQMNNAQNVKTRVQQNFGTGNLPAEPVQNAGKNVGRSSVVGTGKLNRQREKKRGRDCSKLSDSESSDSLSSSDSEEDMEIDENGDLQGGQTSGYSEEQSVRRSSRRKQKVTYTENLSDDEDYELEEKAKGKKRSSCSPSEENGGASKEESAKVKNRSGFAVNREEDVKEVKQEEADEECLQNGNKNTDSSSEEAPESLFSYPDPDFSNFENDRKAEKFAAGQIWAAYDELNAMPRFYARIRKVFTPGFKVQITWLEPDPDDENGINWKNAELPFSCGKFRHGSSEKTDNHPMFSHLIAWSKGSSKDTVVIYPRKGETWALFKDWDINWNRDPDTHRKEYEYEYVEILGDYIKNVGIHVALLSKVKGFVSLFCRTDEVGKRTFLVPPGELLRFSHMIPSSKMKGNEREGVPKGSVELDPAALPIMLLYSSVSDQEVKPMSGCDTDTKRSHSQPQHNCSSVHSASTPEPTEIPEPIFYNFDADKSKEKFQVGQIWALYSDEDGLPKYYGQITKVDSSHKFKLRISWLVSCSTSENFIRLSDKEMPIGCGRFKLKKSGSQSYECNGSFSHLVRAEPAGRKTEFNILPRKGEVWAMYRNWSADIKCSDLKNCEYDIVVVLAADDLQIDVLFLCRVDELASVFKPLVQGGSNIAKSIPRAELLKFSHQIPAFRLTEEKGGKLRGFWELDPAAMPVQYF